MSLHPLIRSLHLHYRLQLYTAFVERSTVLSCNFYLEVPGRSKIISD